MNINDLERLTGITKQNIRFYEKKGLLHPKRNSTNNYREYTEDDLAALNTIKLFRKLDLPLEDIGKIFSEEASLNTTLENHLKVLQERKQRLNACIEICKDLVDTDFDTLDVNQSLNKMNVIEQNGGKFMSIFHDYKKFAATENKKHFSFKPDIMVRNSSEFAEALYQYSDENHLNLVITQTGMYPVFELDGTAYTAHCSYDRFGATIHCTLLNPAELKDISPRRKRIFRFLRSPFPLIILLFLVMAISRQNIGWTFLVAVTLFPYLWWMFSGFK